MADITIVKNNIMQNIQIIDDLEALEKIKEYVDHIYNNDLILTESEKEKLKKARENYKQGKVRKL